VSTAASTRCASKTSLRWEQARAHSRRCIREAAAIVFAEEGFEGATMKRIAEVCGVTKVTLYAHYRDKERLYGSVMDGHLASMPSGELDMQGVADLGDALRRIRDGIGRLAADASCQAFCRTLARSGPASDTYRNHWNAVLEPFFTRAEAAFKKASPRPTSAADSETFLRLVLTEHGLPQGSGPVSRSDATVALFLRAYAAPLQDDAEKIAPAVSKF
jgi:AcrR family transcriptional regulator